MESARDQMRQMGGREHGEMQYLQWNRRSQVPQVRRQGDGRQRLVEPFQCTVQELQRLREMQVRGLQREGLRVI